MNTMIGSYKKSLRSFGIVLFAFGAMTMIQSCSESVNEGSFAVAKDQSITEYLAGESEFSEITKIFNRVTLGRKGNASPLSSVLAARGNYTIFAPNNDAISSYVTSVLGEGKTVDQLTDDQAALIAYSCVIDNGSDVAYESPDFPTDGGAFAKSDLNDRSITCVEQVDSSSAVATNYYLLNGKNRVLKTDKKLSNGYLHTLGSVVAPSNQTVGALIKDSPNMRIMGELLTATAWGDSLNDYLDQQYESEERSLTWTLSQVAPFNVAQHRYYGFTGFVETDDVFQREWNIPTAQYDATTKTVTNASAILSAIEAKAAEVYGTEDPGVYTSSKNALNRFVAYHFLKGKVNYNQFVSHFNEWGYKYGDIKRPQTTKLSVDVSDYYTSVGDPRGLLKVMQEATSRKLYINRTCTYDVSKNYEQVSVKNPGVEILATNEYNGVVYDNNAKNGYFFPITGILIRDQKTSEALASERIRIDLTTMLPELMSYGCRSDRQYVYFPKLTSSRSNGTRGYFENITSESEDTRLLYLHAAAISAPGWLDYQGDEFMVAGVYDFVLKLPPVPAKGTYEIRMGVSHNTLRGMCQIYFGDSPNRLVPAGLPYDMRQSTTNNPNIGWVADVDDEATNAEVDKNMRNQGYMKGPKFFTQTDGKGETSARASSGAVRRIITTQEMEPGKTYYLRFKSALDKSDSQFFSDYIEFVPRSVYNGAVAEDIW